MATIKRMLLVTLGVIILSMLIALFIRHTPQLQNTPSPAEATSSY